MSDISYEQISKTQKTIEDNLIIIEESFKKVRQELLSKRVKILQAIHAQQQEEASKLALISESLKSLVSSIHHV